MLIGSHQRFCMKSQADVDLTVTSTVYRVPALNQQDLDRNFALATTQLLKWMQAARMDFPWMQAGYRALGWLEPAMPRRLLVASQMVRMVQAGALTEAVDKEVVTSCTVGNIGRTTIEFRYRILFGRRLVATGTTTMIVVTGSPGNLKPSLVPDAIRAFAAADEGEDRRFLAESLAALPKEPPSDAYTVTLLIRFSDEDVNRHANHSALARFFEDAKESILANPAASPSLRAVAEQQLEAVLITYEEEARAQDVCEVKVASPGPGVLDIWVQRLAPSKFGGRPGLIGRGRLLCGGGKMPDPELLRVRANL